MQEEVENRTLTLVVNGTKFTGRLFKAAICKYLAHRKEKKLNKQRSRDAPVKPQGKQTVKQLIGQNQGVSNIEITDPSIKEFEKIARKYGVDYAVKKDRSSSPPKYLIFFKGRDADALTAAFTEYTGKKVKKAEKSERPSVLAKLSQFKELVKHAVVDRNKRKDVSYTHLNWRLPVTLCGTNCVTARDASVIRSMSYMSSHSRRTRIRPSRIWLHQIRKTRIW